MFQTHRFHLLFMIFILQIIVVLSKAEEDERRDEANYYEIYEAISTLNSLTTHRTFYEFLEVNPEASNEEIGRAFRKTAVQYHPDKLRHQGKWDERTEKLSSLVQFIGSLLRTEKGRKEYDWILNDAPAWHRQSIYVIRRLVPTSRLTIVQVVIIVIIFSLFLQLVTQWISYAAAWYMIISSRWVVRRMGEKEMRRMKKKIEGSDPSLIAMTNANYHAILLAESKPPSIPNPLNLWIVTLPIYIIKRIFQHNYTLSQLKKSQ